MISILETSWMRYNISSGRGMTYRACLKTSSRSITAEDQQRQGITWLGEDGAIDTET
jgi:hypothetical protein